MNKKHYILLFVIVLLLIYTVSSMNYDFLGNMSWLYNATMAPKPPNTYAYGSPEYSQWWIEEFNKLYDIDRKERVALWRKHHSDDFVFLKELLSKNECLLNQPMNLLSDTMLVSLTTIVTVVALFFYAN